MMLKLVAAWFALMATTVWAQELTFDPEAGLPIRIGDQVVIADETTPWEIDEHDEQVLQVDKGVTRMGRYHRKEFYQLEDRLEYTFQFNLPPSNGTLSYRLFVPLPTSTKVTITHGRYRHAHREDIIEIGRSTRTFSPLRFLKIETPDGAFSIDPDPTGSWDDRADFDKAKRVMQVKATQEGIEIAYNRGWNRYGNGRIRGKLVFYDRPVDFETLHPFARNGWKEPLEPLYFLDFSERSWPRDPVSAGLEPFDEQRGYGWERPAEDLTLERARVQGQRGLVHEDFAAGRSPGTFKMIAPPGDYLLSLIVGIPEGVDTPLVSPGGLGSMTMVVNGQPFATTQIRSGIFAREIGVVSTEDGVITLMLQGSPAWILNGLILQPLMLAHEDYLRRIPWWHHDVDWPTKNTWPQE